MKRFISILILCASPAVAFAWFGFSVDYGNPSWSPDSGKLVFEENYLIPDSGDRYGIRIKSLNGETDSLLTFSGHRINVSADSRHVIIDDYILMNLDGPIMMKDYLKQQDMEEDTSVRRTAWSPEGDKFAFVIYNYENGKSRIGIHYIKENKNVIIVKDEYAYSIDDDDFLIWDDNGVVFTSSKSRQQVKSSEMFLRSVDINGRERKMIPKIEKYRIERESTKALTKYGILYIMPEDKPNNEEEVTAGKSLVLKDRDDKIHVIVPANGSMPVWSPVSDIIAFVFKRKDGKNIWTYDIKTGIYSQVTFEGGTTPRWSSDGAKIAFNRGKKSYVIDANGADIMEMKEADQANFIKLYDPKNGIKSPNGKYTSFIRPGKTKNYESYYWSELIVRDDKNKQIIVGKRQTNF